MSDVFNRYDVEHLTLRKGLFDLQLEYDVFRMFVYFIF